MKMSKNRLFGVDSKNSSKNEIAENEGQTRFKGLIEQGLCGSPEVLHRPGFTGEGSVWEMPAVSMKRIASSNGQST